MAVKKKPNTPVAPETGELSLIRKLAQILNETGLTEIELDHKGAKVRVAKMMQSAAVVHAPPAMVHTPVAAKPMAAAAASATEEVAGTPLKSPMVGTAYLLPSPESPPFVTVGSSVKEGQTVLIIEAMKTMNQIVAPKAGKVVKINVENAQPVEYGEVLMVIE
jgi:acetyl-CoA carboxylase biotin carboxyl carrier protein